MIVTEKQYEEALSLIQDLIATRHRPTPLDAIQLNIPFPSLQSLYSQILKRRVQSDLQQLTEPVRRQIFTRVNSGESLYSISQQLKISPYNLANIYLKMIFQDKVTIAKFLHDPMMISNEDIRSDLLRMIQEDLLSSPEIDLMKDFIGEEYEDVLVQCLSSRHMEFETEEDSRRKGRQKTPDVLFTIPMALRCDHHSMLSSHSEPILDQMQSSHLMSRDYRSDSFNSQFMEDFNYMNQGMSDPNLFSSPSSMNNFNPDVHNSNVGHYLIVNWIDSKAMFADKYTFEENLAQFRTYINRYGRGMVIYWHGFTEDILKHPAIQMNDDLIIRDSFPEDWIFPTGEPADGRKPMFDEIIIPPPPDQNSTSESSGASEQPVEINVVEGDDENPSIVTRLVSASPYASPSKEHARLQALRSYSM